MPRIDYDKSKLINKKPDDLLAKIPMSNGMDFLAIRYMPKEEKVIYSDENIIIEKIGTLNYKQLTACMDYITKYRITKDDKEYEVYTTILSEDMKINEQYRKSVLEVLLGDNNVELSNCFGYVGTISDKNADSVYDIDSEYFLTANEVEATVVYEYVKMMKKIREESKNRITNETKERDD